jgi:hypothetical protein
VSLYSLRAAPFNLLFDSYVVAKVKSKNYFGWSVDSAPNTGGAKILIEPSKMSIPIYDPLVSTGVTVVIELIELSSYQKTGGSAIDSYYVEYSVANSNSWTCLQGDVNNFTLSSRLTVPNLVIGQIYSFRAKAHNINGWGLLSEPL